MQEPTKIIPIEWATHAERAQDLQSIVQAYGAHPLMRHRALQILRDAGVRRPDQTKSARAIFEFIKKNLPYHLEHGEQIELPGHTLRNLPLGADCDGHAILTASLISSLGIPSRLAYWTPPGMVTPVHVSVAYWTGDRWENLDTTQEHPAGWTPPGHTYTRGTGTRARKAAELRDGRDTTPPKETQWSGTGNLGIYIPLVSEAVDLASDAVDAAVDLVEEAVELVEDGLEALADLTIALLETVAGFVESFLKKIGNLARAAFNVLKKVIEGLVEWVADPRTWGRLLMAIAACGPAIAASGPGAPAVLAGCVSSWAQSEVVAIAADAATEELEEYLGIDIPDFLEPHNLQRLANGVDWDNIGEIAIPEAEGLADAALTYAKKEAMEIVEGAPGRVGEYLESKAMEKLEAIPGFNSLPAAAKNHIRQTVRSRGQNIQAMSSEGMKADIAAAERLRNAVPDFDELPGALRAELEKEFNRKAMEVPETAEAIEAIQQQMQDASAAKIAILQTMGVKETGDAGWLRAGEILADLGREIDKYSVQPEMRNYYMSAGLADLWPPTPEEIAIFRRAGEWSGDTAAKMVAEGRFTPFAVMHFRGGTMNEPMAGMKAAIKYRIEGAKPNEPMLKALMSTGRPLEAPPVPLALTAAQIAGGAILGGAGAWALAKVTK